MNAVEFSLSSLRARRHAELMRLLTAIRRSMAAWQKARQVRRDMEHLCELPDHLLRDIGITRDDIPRIGRPHER